MWPFKNALTTSPAAAAQSGQRMDPQQVIDYAVAEMASNHLAKESKLALAQNAVMIRDLEQLSETEHRDQRAFKAKHLGGLWLEATGDNQMQAVSTRQTEDEMGHGILICDDYHYNDRPQVVQAKPSGPAAAPWVVAAAMAAALGGAGLAMLLAKPQPQQPGVTQKIENTEGFLIELVPPPSPSNGLK